MKNFIELYGIIAAMLLVISLASPVAIALSGVQPLLLNTISQTTGDIKIDGTLSDWDDAKPANFSPFEQTLMTDVAPELLKVMENPHTAAVRSCYDNDALYILVEWQGKLPAGGIAAKSAKAEDALSIHIYTDRMAHFSFRRLSAGDLNKIDAWYDDGKDAVNVAKMDARCVITASADGKKYIQEIMLPWKLITRSGKKPADAKMRVMFDFSWNDLPAELIKKAPLGVLHQQKFITVGLLTAPEKLFDNSGYLPNPGSWGNLQFNGQVVANDTVTSPFATGATITNVAPVAQAPAIDGKLAGWDSSLFQTISFAPGYLGDRYRGKIGVMYDDKNLYIAVHAFTGWGQSNVEHELNQRGFWGGDNLQIRLNDGKRTVNLCGWYDTSLKQPALTADGKNLAAPFLLKEGAKEAFIIDADGSGYTQEISIPFVCLGMDTPKPGTIWKATFQLWWAALTPQFSAFAESGLQAKGGVAYKYTIPEEANVTLGVYNDKGQLLRWIIRAAHRYAGVNTEYWNGLDQWGQPLAAGSYQIKVITSPPIGLDYKMTIGNPGTPPWPTADGKGDWIGDESSPQGAATDGDWVFLASPCAEKGWSIIGVDGNGQRQWGYGVNSQPRCVSLAVYGNYLYALYSGPETTTTSRHFKSGTGAGRDILICLNKKTGKLASFSQKSPELIINRWAYREEVSYLWDLRANKTFHPGNYGGQPRYFTADVGESTNGLGITANADNIFIASYYDDKVLVIDAATAQKTDEISVPKPVGLRAVANGKLLAVSGNSVLEIDLKTKASSKLIDNNLVAPHSITTDKNGLIYISDWGTSFQVKVFSAGGAYLRAVGTPGGRPWIGKWDAGGLLVPRGIAVTDTNKLWVAEDDNNPSRVSVWDSNTGKLIKDYIGPSSYGGGNWFWVNPKDPGMIMTEGTFFNVDHAKKSWTPVSTALRRLTLTQPFMPNGASGMPTSKTVTHNGKTYIYVSDNMGVTALRLDGEVLTPVASVGQINEELSVDGTAFDVWDSDLGHHRYMNCRPAFFAGHAGHIYCWNDTNNDGQVQENEMQWAPMNKGAEPLAPGKFGRWEAYWGVGIGPDGSIYFHTSNGKHNQVFRMDVDKWTNDGVPVYTLANAKKIIDNDNLIHVLGMYVTSMNKLVISFALEWPPLPKNAIECYDRNGNQLWAVATYPGAQQIDDPAATNISGDFNIPGIGNVIGSWQWHLNQHSYLLTDDGMYLTWLCDDNVGGPTQNWGESMRSYYQTPNGDVYLVNGGADSYHLLKITGVQQAKRIDGGKMVLTEDDVRQAEISRQSSSSEPAVAQKPVIRIARVTTPPVIDGTLTDWNMSAGITMSAGSNRSAEAAISRDAANLYLAYRVHGSAMLNKGADWRTLFITGDCVDIMLSTGKALDKPHFAPAEGDVRVLFAQFNGTPVAVLYRPVVPGTKNPIRLMAANIDQIIRLDSAKVAMQRTADGYTLEASLPLADIGIDPAKSADLRGDMGVIFADQTGANRTLRMYYYNKQTKIVDDLTTESTLQPGDWGQIEMPLGVNLLKNGGFEEPFVNDQETGWAVLDIRNGARASLSTELSHSGRQSLLFECDPPVFKAEDYKLADYGDFLKSANGDKGGGHVAVVQRIPVTAGRKYWVKASYRAMNMSNGEKKTPGDNRGYIAMSITINWIGAKNPNESWQKLFGDYNDNPNWLIGLSGIQHMNSAPYIAPEGATKATVIIRFVDNFADKQPKGYVDDVEFVEVVE